LHRRADEIKVGEVDVVVIRGKEEKCHKTLSEPFPAGARHTSPVRDPAPSAERPQEYATPALLEAYSGHRPARLPVWFMRQAGRSLPEYRAVRAGTEMLEACLRPELAAEITVQPVRRHGV